SVRRTDRVGRSRRGRRGRCFHGPVHGAHVLRRAAVRRNQIVKREAQEYLKTHATLTRVHVLGRKDVILNSGFMEFGWANSLVDVYIRDMVKNVLDDVGVPSDIEVTSAGAAATQLTTPGPAVPADALLI